MAGLKKVNGRGVHCSTVKPKSSTKQVVVGNCTYVGKNSKDALYLLGARKQWEQYTRVGQSKATTCGRQMPYSIKAR